MRSRILWLQEALSAGGSPGLDEPGLRAEGCAMRDTLAADLAPLLPARGLRLGLALGPGEAGPGRAALDRAGAPAFDAATRPVRTALSPAAAPSGVAWLSPGELPRPGEDALARLRRAAALPAWVWGIAPESGGLLAAWAEAVCALDPARWLGCRPAAIRLASSKAATVAAWRRAGLLVPDDLAAADAAWVLKPDDGAGGLATVRVPDRATAQVVADRPRAAGPPLRLEPHVDGEALSLSLAVAADGSVRVLARNRQTLAWRPDAEGLAWAELGAVQSGALDADPRGPALDALARRAVAALPGLRGFVGLDLVWHPVRGPVPIELNPRLTSAYVGLPAARRRALLGDLLDDALGPAPGVPARPRAAQEAPGHVPA